MCFGYGNPRRTDIQILEYNIDGIENISKYSTIIEIVRVIVG